MSISVPPQSSQRLNHQPKSTHGGTNGSSHMGSRGWPGRTSVGGEALGFVKAHCPRVGEYQVREAGVGGLVIMGRWDGIEGFQRENEERVNI